MARNIILDGIKRITVIAPAAVNSGDLVQVAQSYGIALTNAASAANVVLSVGPTATLRKLNGASTSQAAGSNVHWDLTNANCTVSATSNLKIGVAMAATANADTTINVHLNPSF